MSLTPFHVVIIGGGIGGLCLAHALKKAGMSFCVYERNASDMWSEGYRIHINPVGSRALYECLPSTLWDTFTMMAGTAPHGLGFLTERLEELLVIGDRFMSNTTGNVIDAHYPTSRRALRRLLLTGLEDSIQFERTFEHYEHTAEGKVRAYFTDGTSVTGDILVAADGANSRVRQQYLPQAPRREIGAAAIGGKLLLTEQNRDWLPHQLASRLNLIMPKGPYCLFTAPFDHIHHTGKEQTGAHRQTMDKHRNDKVQIEVTQDYMLWALIAPVQEYREIQHLDEKGLLDAAGQRIAGWHPTLQRLIAESDPPSTLFAIFKASTIITEWQSSRVTLLGDAIHNMPPVGGLGGNMALRDAASLARALIDVQNGKLELQRAIHGYEVEMRKHGFAAVRTALAYTQQAITGHRLARSGSRLWFRACQMVPPLKSRFEEEWSRPMRNTERERRA